jgi:hypothetical protein
VSTWEGTWQPHEGPQTEFLRRVEYEALFGGAKGPGKTDALIYGGLRQIDHPRYHGAMFRRTYPELQEILDRMYLIFPRLGGSWNEQKKRWTFPSGAKYSGFYMKEEKDKYLHQGKEYHYIAFDQVEQMSETQYTFIMGCSRTSHEGIECQMRSSANPGGVGHVWVKERFIDLGDSKPHTDPITGLTRVFVSANIWDNPTLLKADPQYLQRLLSLPEAERRAFLYGDWEVFAGQYFPEYRRDKHTIPYPDGGLPPYYERLGGMDWGYDPSSGVVLIAAVDPHERVVVDGELTFKRTPPKAVAHLIHEKWPTVSAIVYADPSMWAPSIETGISIADTINEQLNELGSNIIITKANRDRMNGWAQVHQYLAFREGPDGPCPWIFIVQEDPETDRGCPRLIKTIPAQVHDERMSGDLLKGSTDHWCDALRYMLMSRPPLTEVPTEGPKGHGGRVTARTAEIMKQVAERHNAIQGDYAREIEDLGFDLEPEVASIWS